MTDQSILNDLLDRYPDIERIEVFVTDVNGVSRGKWLPRGKANYVTGAGIPLPRSVFALDVWGRDVEAAGLAFGTGDPDGLCFEIPGTAGLVTWAAKPTAQVMLSMGRPDELPFYAEPRGVLARVTAETAKRGWRAVAAFELEFYLVDTRSGPPVAPGEEGRRWQGDHGQVLGLDALRVHAGLFDDIEAACHAQNIPVDTILRENGPGQYEVNLRHVADPMQAADHAILLKRIVRHVAHRHGLVATFMAKPYGDQSGSGMHVHCSLLDDHGRALFSDEGSPSEMMHHAVAGLVSRLPEFMLALAPHFNSYRRFRVNSHAPTHANWGIDDRSAAIRLIVGSPAATRIEQRVAGADANPYLVLAGTLGAMIDGIDGGVAAPLLTGESQALPAEWGHAIDQFASSEWARDCFGEAFRNMFVACKRQDFDGMLARVSDVEIETCLDLI